jgi:hypothetical protein
VVPVPASVEIFREALAAQAMNVVIASKATKEA